MDTQKLRFGSGDFFPLISGKFRFSGSFPRWSSLALARVPGFKDHNWKERTSLSFISFVISLSFRGNDGFKLAFGNHRNTWGMSGVLGLLLRAAGTVSRTIPGMGGFATLRVRKLGNLSGKVLRVEVRPTKGRCFYLNNEQSGNLSLSLLEKNTWSFRVEELCINI